MSQYINIDAGEVEYCDPPILITADHDISGDTVQMGLGGYTTPPDTWIDSTDPAVLLTRPTPQQVQATLLIGDTIRPAGGTWWLYLRIVDTPEQLNEKSFSRVVVTNSGTVTYP